MPNPCRLRFIASNQVVRRERIAGSSTFEEETTALRSARKRKLVCVHKRTHFAVFTGTYAHRQAIAGHGRGRAGRFLAKTASRARRRARRETSLGPVPRIPNGGPASAWFQAGEEDEVVGHDRGPAVSFAAQGATRQAVGAFAARDASFDTGAEVAELAIDPLASDQRPAFLETPDVFAAARLSRVAKPPSAAAALGHRRRRGAPASPASCRCRPGCRLRSPDPDHAAPAGGQV